MVQTLVPNLVLVGFMGSGKSTIGRLCARALGFRCVDTDARVERQAGRTVAQVFNDEGEVRFRLMEQKAVSDLAMRVNVVIATGGGAVLDPANAEVLRASGVVVWLRVEAEEILRRCGSRESRPLLADASDPLERIRQMLADREPFYRRAADTVVETSGLRREEAAPLVLGAYRSLAQAWPDVPGRAAAT